MGRLTLNVPLSFAQFEREVTGERIRDKIAASKRRGMWMGGTVALGCDVSDHRLVINPAEAETVKGIFQLYLELRSVRLLKDDLDQRGIISKIRLSRNGNRSGGRHFPAARSTSCFPTRSTSARSGTAKNATPASTSRQWSVSCGSKLSASCAIKRPGLKGPLPRRAQARWRASCSTKTANAFTWQEPPSANGSIDTMFRATWSRAPQARCGRAGRLSGPEIERAVAVAARQLLNDHAAISASACNLGVDPSDIPAMLGASGDWSRWLQSEADSATALTRLVDKVNLKPCGIGFRSTSRCQSMEPTVPRRCCRLRSSSRCE